MQLVSLLLCFGIAIGASLCAHAGKQQPFVLYGEDSRYEYDQIPNYSIRTLADSTVILVLKTDLQAEGKSHHRANVKSWADTDNYCTDEPFATQPSLGFCSGSLIAPNLVLTAGHCFKNKNSCKSTSFIFDFNTGNISDLDEPLVFKNSKIYDCKELIYHADSNSADFAVVELDRPVTDRNALAMASSEYLRENSEIFMLGYPMGIPLKYADDAHVREIRQNTFIATLDAFSANSGSAVFSRETNEIVGILVAGEDDTVYDRVNQCYRTKRCTEAGCRGETVMKISVLRKRLGI